MFSSSTRGRFAPSPSGPLHAGSLLVALGSWLRAKQAGGQWWLRIEDIDPPRELAGAAQAQQATLRAFGLHADGDVVFQSQRDALYQQALDTLLASGQAFECHCSRSVLAASGGIHRHCVAGPQRPDPAIRLRVADGCTVAFADAVHGRIAQRVDVEVGDFVLRRSDGLWAYQLAVVVDDAAQGITEVVRGADLLDSTPRQRLLQQALGLPTPAYAHLPLLLGEDGKKLSKSSAALPVNSEQPIATLSTLWACLGQPALPRAAQVSVPVWLGAALAQFRLERVPTGAIALSAALHNTISTRHA
jgi:glutamyl-Q tRNA(Asp) synthetase